MNTFNSSGLFVAFLVFVVIFLVLVLLDLVYHQCTTHTENPIYGQHHSFRFHVKQLIARILLKLGKRECISDIEADKIQVFSDADDKVNTIEVLLKLR